MYSYLHTCYGCADALVWRPEESEEAGQLEIDRPLKTEHWRSWMLEDHAYHCPVLPPSRPPRLVEFEALRIPAATRSR